MATADLTRRALLQKGVVVGAMGAAALTFPGLVNADSEDSRGDHHDIGKIYDLQAAFHSAKSHQNIDLMVSLWAEDSTFTNAGVTYAGTDAVRAFFLTTGLWLHHRISFVPSFKDQIEIHGDSAFVYFECHDVDLATGAIVTHLFNAGALRNVRGRWLFKDMHFGSAAPLSVDTIYYP